MIKKIDLIWIIPVCCCLAALCWFPTPQSESLTPQSESLTPQSESLTPRPAGLIPVKILECCRNLNGKPWYLIETGDGQRGFIGFYRGEVGDRFYMWPEDIGGYKSEPTLPIGEIDLGVTDVANLEK